MQPFLSHGDFSFPFTWPYYLYKQLFMWSFRSGTPNPDGIIKMPGRLPELILFMASGDNLLVSYFFIFSSLALVFAAFYYFASSFLRIKSVAIKSLGALLYTFNPVTLGNLAKTGLLIAAAMLPISLIAVNRIFEKRQFRYMLLWLICLNVSLIHPFNFIVNASVSGCYFIYLAWDNRRFVWEGKYKIISFAGVGLLLSAYFLLPMAAVGTVSKDVINSSANSSPTDYTAMVEILSTRDLLTGFSLSKDVVIDFAYYDGWYTALYFLGIIAFYILLIGLYVQVEKRLSDIDRRRVVLSLSAFLSLILLATVTIWNIDSLIKVLIQMPGGWAFRSPLKWQLYIPMALVTMLIILMTYLKSKRWRTYTYGGLIAVFLLMNGFLFYEIYHRLLVPRHITKFSSLAKKQFNHENMLLVSSFECASPDQENRRIRTELEQILVSKDIQLKQLKPEQSQQVNLESYSYIMDCENLMKDKLKESYNFELEATYAEDSFQLYRNRNAKPYIYASHNLFDTTPEQLGSKQKFIASVFGHNFNFVDSTTQIIGTPTTKIIDPFQDLSFDNIQQGNITSTAKIQQNNTSTLYIRQTDQPLYYQYDSAASTLNLSKAELPHYQLIPRNNNSGYQAVPIDLTSNETNVNFIDSSYNYQNLIPNPSLEEGPWQSKVSDCYAVDDKADIGMEIIKGLKTDGEQSLQLWSKNHIGCAGPNKIPLKSGNYLLGFDYQSKGGHHAGYAVMLNRPDRTILSQRLKSEPNRWQKNVEAIEVPDGVTALRLLLHAYPDTPGVVRGTANFDNFQLTSIPDIQNRLYFAQNPDTNFRQPQRVDYGVINPTKSAVSIKSATTPFYLMTTESYSPKWRLSLGTQSPSWLPFNWAKKIGQENHLQINGSMNAWYMDPSKLCQDNTSGCTKNADGSYNMELTAEFTPQRWLYLGIAISGLTFVGALAGLGYVTYTDRKKGHYAHP